MSRIIHLRDPVCRFRGNRINRQSNLPTAPEFDPVFTEIDLFCFVRFGNGFRNKGLSFIRREIPSLLPSYI